ncbi:MAG: hypothetical protein ACR2OE_07895 [Thermomicrobiales bacterium]
MMMKRRHRGVLYGSLTVIVIVIVIALTAYLSAFQNRVTLW